MPIDVAIIGGGPAGLSAAIGAAAEGLEVAVLVSEIGGQAGTSSRIENYMGFPGGISGPALASRARRQALKFGATLIPCRVVEVDFVDDCFHILTASGSIIRARSVIVASGAQYRRLDPSTDFERFEGKGVHYACTPSEVRRKCRCDDVVVIGGGNSAGQAAMFLSGKARHVHLLVRKDSLRETMSVYLLDRIERSPNITVHYGCETDSIGGRDEVETVTFRNRESGAKTILPVSDVYVMIGATPNCGFIHGLCDVDAHGFIKTDDYFQTSHPRLYAVGDVRAGSVKRVANAAGEGATSIKWLWQALNAPVSA